MAEIKESRLIIRLLDNVTGPSRRVMKSLNRMKLAGDRMRAATIAPMGINTAAIRNMALLGGGYIGLSRAMDSTVGSARNFEAAMREIAIKGDLSDKAMKRFGERLTNLSPISNQTTDDLTKAADAMVGYGLDIDRTVDAMPAIAKAATASGAAIDDLAKSAATLMQSFKVDPKQISDVLDMMVTGGNLGALELKDMAAGFPALVAGAKSLGMEGPRAVADLVAALEIARRGAGDSATAINNLQNLLQKALSPTTLKNFKKMGVDVRKELEEAVENGVSPIERLIEIVDKVTNHGRADLLGQLFQDKQILEGLRPLIADFKDYQEIRNKVEHSSGAAQRAYIRRMENANEKMKAFGIRMRNLGRSLGENMLDPLGNAAEHLTKILDTLGHRATILDKLKSAFDGLAHGAGFKDATTAITQFGQAVEKMIFGSTDEDAGAALGRIFKRFEEWGQQVRAFADAVSTNPIGKFLADMAGKGFKLMLASTAISIFAGALWKLGRAAAFLTGLTAAAGIIKGLIKATSGLAAAGTTIAASVGGKTVAKAIPAGAAAATGATVAAAEKVATAGKAVTAGDALVATGRATTAASGLEKAALSMTRASGLFVRAASKALGWPTIATEVVARALIAKGLSDDRFKNPDQAPAIMRQAEDRREGREPVQVPEPAEAKPFSLGQLWADLTKPIKPTVDDQAVKDFVQQSAMGGEQVKKSLSVTAKPTIDTTSLDAAMAKAAAFARQLLNLGGATVSSPITGGPEASSPSPASSPVIAGARAGGGPVRRGLNYLVGEEGTELFTPDRSGTIIPNHALGGGEGRRSPIEKLLGPLELEPLSIAPLVAQVAQGLASTPAAPAPVQPKTEINNTFHVAGSNADEVVQKLVSALQRQLVRSRQTEMDGRPLYEW